MIYAAKTLNDKGQCCGRKPLVYRRDKYLFCSRCDTSFDFDGHQQANWAWKAAPGGFVPTYPNSDYVKAATPAAPDCD